MSPSLSARRRAESPSSSAHDPSSSSREPRRLSTRERRLLALLGLPSFGLALSITTISAYLPVLVKSFTSNGSIIGTLIGGEGLFALILPLAIGSWSDGIWTRYGRRLPFMLAAAPVAVAALVLLPLGHSLLAIGLLLFGFYLAYFTYYAPYRALYPDLLGDEEIGRAQGIQGLFREGGLGLALVGGGVLLGLWRPLPFLIAGAVLLAVTAVMLVRLRVLAGERPTVRALPSQTADGVGPREATARIWRVVRDHPDLRILMVANALWELTLAALKTFVVLFIVVGLGRSVGTASLVLAVVAVAAIAAALVGGSLADRLGPMRVMHVALWFYGLGALVPFFTRSLVVLGPVIAVVAFAAGVVMTLPYALMIELMPPQGHGVSSGLYGFSRGAGTLLGPIIAGSAIDLLRPVLPATHGYSAMFLVASASILLSIPLLSLLQRRRRRADAAPG